ncbi:MAG: hypothetical protein WC525_01470, partial [Candidatus Thermoplasmatota archaeon]
MKKSQKNLIMTVGVIIIFLMSCGISSISGTITSTNIETLNQHLMQTKKEDAVITCYVGGVPHTRVLPAVTGVSLQNLFNTLVEASARDPDSRETQELQHQILLYAEQHDLLPRGLSAATILTQLHKKGQTLVATNSDHGVKSASYEGTSRELFCNFASAGQGSAFPIIILPRFIPLLMTPIPRLFVGWKTPMGITSCGGLLSHTGCIASGEQQGFALGF